MTKPEPDLIEQLLAAATEAKATIRELHEARRDARTAVAELTTAMAQLDAKAAAVRSEVIEGINELVRQEWQRAFDAINLHAMGAGLKKTFDQWIDHLADARKVLDKLRAHEQAMAVNSAAVRKLQGMLP